MKLVTLRYSPCDPPAYLLEFDACPYLGAHITLAVLRVTLRVGRFDGSVQTVECRLLRSFPLPPHLRDFVKQPF